MDYQAKSLHYFHIYGVLDRIDFSSLDDNIRIPDTTKIDFAEIMPSLEDVIAIKKCFSLHILRTLKKYSSFFFCLLEKVWSDIYSIIILFRWPKSLT